MTLIESPIGEKSRLRALLDRDEAQPGAVGVHDAAMTKLKEPDARSA